jgi:hypothetical protein
LRILLPHPAHEKEVRRIYSVKVVFEQRVSLR